jgi:hypothetical protein
MSDREPNVLKLKRNPLLRFDYSQRRAQVDTKKARR